MFVFECSRYPSVVMHDGARAWAEFKDGRFDTADADIAARLRNAPHVNEVSAPEPDPEPKPAPKRRTRSKAGAANGDAPASG